MSAPVLAVALARVGSTRLPGKMLLPFGDAPTVVDAALRRAARCESVGEVVLATSTHPRDDVLADVAARCGVPLIRGSEDDVVARMMRAVSSARVAPDLVVRVCCDNPLLIPSLVDDAVRQLRRSGADLITPFEFNTLPFGVSAVVFTRRALERIDQEARAPAYREHVENFCFENPERFAIQYQAAPPGLSWRELVLTLDVAIDRARLERFRRILDGVPPGDELATLIAAREQAAVTNAPVTPAVISSADGEEFHIRVLQAPDGPRYGICTAGSNAPVFLDVQDNTTRDTPAAFFARARSRLTALLAAGPLRQLSLIEGPRNEGARSEGAWTEGSWTEGSVPPAEKRVRASRRSFAHPRHVTFPPRVVIALPATSRLSEDGLREGGLSDDQLSALCAQLARGPVEAIEVTDHPAAARIRSLLQERLGAAPLQATPPQAGPLNAAPLCEEMFTTLRVHADGRLTLGEAPIGHLRDGLEAAWNGEPAWRHRVAILNGGAP